MTLKPKSLIARTLALICTLGLAGAAWGGLPTITVSGNDVTISNDSGSHGNIGTNNGGYDTLTIPAATDLDSGTVLRIKSISFGARTAGIAAPASITLAGVDSAAAQVTANGYTDRDKYTYVFETPCLMKVGTGSTISFKNASGNQVNVGLAASMIGSTGQDNYLFTTLKSTGSWSVLTEIVAEKVTGYINGTADGFNTTITSKKVYVSGVTGYWNTPDGLFGNVDELVVVDGEYQFGHKIVNGNSPRGGFPNRGTAFKKLSGTGTITNGDYASEPSPVICVCDTSEFAGSINIGNGTTRPTILFCTEGEISAGIDTSLGATLQSLFTSETGRSRIYISPGRTAATNAVVIVPAGKTWTAVNGIENRGELVVNGTVSCKIVNSGKLIVNGTVTGMISGSGTVVVSEGATVSSIGSQRDFTGWTIDSSIPVKITMTTEEYGKGSVSVTGVNGISSIPVLAPDGTTEVGTITLEAGAGTLETGVKTSGLSTWCDYEFNGDKSNTGVDETGLTSDVDTTSYPEIFNNSMLYTYTHPWRNISYPNSWTAVVRCTVPELENAVVVMFGTYGAGAIGLVAGPNPEEEMLLVSTPGSSAATSEAKHFTTLATMNVKDATTAQHVYVFTKDGTTVNVYCDGEKVLDNYVLASATLGGGLQVGSLHGGVVQSNVHTGLVRFGAGESQISSLTLAQQQNARIDCMRMFDYIVSPEQIAALSVEFPAVKLYRATVAENAETSWTDLTWTPAWDGGNTQSKVILTTDGGATVALPESITVDEVQLDLAENSTLTLSGPGSLAVTQPITIEDGTLELTGTVTLTQDTTFNGSVVFNQFTKEGDGDIQLSNGATVGVVGVDAALVVTPLGTYTLAEGTVVDSAYTSGEGDVKLIPLASAVVSITQGETTLYYSDLDTALGPLQTISDISDDVEVVLLNGTTLPVGYDQALISIGYYISGSTITKAVAKCNNSTYPTLAAAVEAATDGATVTLLLASSEEITLNDKAITLSETANFSGTLAGNGTVTFATLPASALTFGDWTGTVAIPEIRADKVNFNNYGISGSTVKLAGGMSGGWLAEEAVEPAIEIPGDKKMTIASFSPSFANTFAALKGAGTFKITATADAKNDLANVSTWGEGLNYSAYIRIADVSQFTGWMYNTADVGIAFGESKPTKNTPGGKFYVTGDVSIGELNVPGNSEFKLFGGGTLTMENSVVNGGDADIYGTLTVEDATLSIGKSTNAKWIILRNNAAVINLDGGTLSICRMTAWSDYTVNFNGGVLQSYGSGWEKENIIGGTGDDGSHAITLNVLADGAIIDNVIDTAIAPEMTGAGLTKKGTGTLTLAAAPTFTSAISVEAGKVVLPKGTYTLAAGTVVESDDGTNMTLAPGVAITVPSVDNATVTVKVGEAEVAAASDVKYYVVPGSTVTVTYSAAGEDFAIADGTVVLEAVTEAQTVQAPTVSVVNEMWTGAALDNNWNTPANWNHNAVPTAETAVTIPWTGNGTTIYVGNGEGTCGLCKTLTLNDNLTLTSDANNSEWCYVSVHGDVTGTGTLILCHAGIPNDSGSEITVSCPVVIAKPNSTYGKWDDSYLQTGPYVVTGDVNVHSRFNVYGAANFQGKVTIYDCGILQCGNPYYSSDYNPNPYYGNVTLANVEVKATSTSDPAVLIGGQFSGHIILAENAILDLSIGTNNDQNKVTDAANVNFKLSKGSKLSVPAGALVTEANITAVDSECYVAKNGTDYTVLDLVTFTVEVPENTTVTVTGAKLVEGNNYQASIGAEVTITYTPTGAYVGEAVQQVVTVTQNQAAVQAPAEYAPVPAVAQIGNDYYATLQAAVDQGDVTVKILGDVTLADKLVVDGRQTVVFEADSAVTVTGQLRVVDGSNCTIGENVTFTSADHPTVFVLGDPAVRTPGTAKSTLVVDGTVANTNPTFDGAFAISGNGLDTRGADITINGTVTNPKGIAIYQPQPGSLTVNGRVSGASAISIKDGTLTVGENAVVTAVLADGKPYVGNNNGESPTGDAIIAPYYPASKGYGTPVVNIQGGTITVADTANCAGIEAYDFNGVAAPEDASSNVNVSGGTFNTPVELKYCATGVIPADNGSGSYGVEAGYVITWVVDGEPAITTVKAGETPTMTDPTKDNYEFNGWTPTVVAATANATYTATWTAKGVTLGPPAVVWGADFTNAVVSATVADGYDGVAYTLTYNSNVYASTVKNGKVTFNVPVAAADRYEDFSYTIDAKFGDSFVGSANGSAIVADKKAWFSATATTTTGGEWANTPTVEGVKMTFSGDNTFTPTAASSGKIVVIDMGKVVFGDTNDTEINDAQAGIRIGSNGKFEVMSATGWTPTTVDADGETEYNVVVTIDYKAKTYSVNVGEATISGITLASSATKVTSIEFNGAGSLESLTGEYFEGAMVKDAKGATYDTVEAAIAALNAGTATAPLTLLHEGTAPDGWTIDEDGVLTRASIVVESTDDKTLVAVPQGCTSIDDLIDLSNRFKGDQVQVYDSKTGKFNTWELSATKEWEGVGRQDEDDVPPVYPTDADKVLKAGQAVWVLRTTDASKTAPIKLNATYAAADAKVEVAVTTGWTLVAPLPKTEAFDLNDLSVKGGSFSDGDMIVIPGAAAPINCVRKDGEWKVYTITVKEDSNAPAGWGPIATGASWDVAPTVPAGKGFFFVSESEKTLEL